MSDVRKMLPYTLAALLLIYIPYPLGGGPWHFLAILGLLVNAYGCYRLTHPNRRTQ